MLEKYIEQITAPATIFRRAGEGQGATVDPLKGIIEGCPIVFEQRTAIGDYFYEVIDTHALDGADLSDIKFMVNHDDGMIPLARHRRGKRSTMDISVDNVGMHINNPRHRKQRDRPRTMLGGYARRHQGYVFCVRYRRIGRRVERP